MQSLDFDDNLIISAMNSSEGEKVPFVDMVDPKGKNIEQWMVEICKSMISGLRFQMLSAIQDYTVSKRTDWMQKWPGMIVLNGSQAHWTRECEEYMKEKGNAGVRQYWQDCVTQLNDMVFLIRGKLSKNARMTVGALAVIDVHARDVLKKMADAGVKAPTDFDWVSQMRFYWEGDYDTGDLKVVMVSSKRQYGYEYLGNTFRLVITPLTDKCYMTLMGALQMILGGAPAGPAGTGKTETTKDLAKALAVYCVVFNCSDQLDYRIMGGFFSGLAQQGAWACFDEFNRIGVEVLSVIAQQLLCIFTAINKEVDEFEFEGNVIPLASGFGVFITMNPGYAGRTELPDNLKALFRPVAMMVPDYRMIAEIILFSEVRPSVRPRARERAGRGVGRRRSEGCLTQRNRNELVSSLRTTNALKSTHRRGPAHPLCSSRLVSSRLVSSRLVSSPRASRTRCRSRTRWRSSTRSRPSSSRSRTTTTLGCAPSSRCSSRRASSSARSPRRTRTSCSSARCATRTCPSSSSTTSRSSRVGDNNVNPPAHPTQSSPTSLASPGSIDDRLLALALRWLRRRHCVSRS